jgi:large subunit ribosomal protein L33
MAKINCVIITLECTEARKEGKPPSRYVTTKNKSTIPSRLEKMKYNPNLKRHTLHREIK